MSLEADFTAFITLVEVEETSFEWLIIQCSRLSHGENGSFSLSPSK